MPHPICSISRNMAASGEHLFHTSMSICVMKQKRGTYDVNDDEGEGNSGGLRERERVRDSREIYICDRRRNRSSLVQQRGESAAVDFPSPADKSRR